MPPPTLNYEEPLSDSLRVPIGQPEGSEVLMHLLALGAF